jgi:ferredoxin-NADP reductase
MEMELGAEVEAGAERELDLVVAERDVVGLGVVGLTLRSPDGAALPVWSPGAHIDLTLTPGLTRQYSLCGDPADRACWRIAVLRERGGRGGSVYVHDRLHEGAEVRIRGPRNHFELIEAPRYLFVAGGIGITPILPMLAAAHSAGADWRLLYGGRTAASMAFGTQLATGYGARVRLRPQDEYGLLDLETFLAEPSEGTLIYACGPEPLLQAVQKHSGQWGWDPGALRTERFAPARQVGAPVRADGFEVVLARSGLTLRIGAGQSILGAVEDAGVEVLSSCREGTCGTCETEVLEGRPDHRDSLLTPQEREACDTMFICVSRSLDDRLVLDL